MFPESIASFIEQEEASYRTREVEIFDNYRWSMTQHIQMSASFKLGKFLHSSNDPRFKAPFKNIVIKNLRLRYRAEDIDVKDITLYVDDPEKHHLSFLIKKYHDDVFIIENDLDTFFDVAKEEKIDLGGVLIKKGQGAVPEVLHLQGLAFCDQTNILGGPIGFKFNFSPDTLRTKAKLGWGDPKNGATISIEDLIVLAKREKDPAGTTEHRTNKTTGKIIEVYIVRGQMPEDYLNGGDMETMVNQVQVIAFYHDENNDRQSQILFRNKEVEDVLKFHDPEPIFNRALGFGGVEELFDPQIWTNFAEIHKTNMLKAGSKLVFQTDDDGYANRNKIRDMENLEITVTKEGSRIDQVPTGSPNIQLFNESLVEWEEYAQDIAGATDALLGKAPPAGSPFALQRLVTKEGKGLHEYRRGKYAKFIEEIYKDWIIPEIAKKITKGMKFLSTLSSDETLWLIERVSVNRAAKAQWESILTGKQPDEFEVLVQKERDTLAQGGNQIFLEILKEELKGVELKVKVNVVGKQKDLVEMAGKAVDVLRQFLATPQLRQDPFAMKLVSKVLEWSGMDTQDLAALAATPALPPAPESATKPLKELATKAEAVA